MTALGTRYRWMRFLGVGFPRESAIGSLRKNAVRRFNKQEVIELPKKGVETKKVAIDDLAQKIRAEILRVSLATCSNCDCTGKIDLAAT